ncbi:TRAP transporter small permease subunit [Frigidibacter sp. MR17.14]|uniref:TRAP transporter small permease n=1 Tax=Frigidibacter sp. MR17.14 TaxID=3126509 RepID=UPI00301316C4
MSGIRTFHGTAIRAVTVAMLVILLALMIVQVVLRYVFGTSLIWAEEVCRYLLIWGSFLAAILAYERGEIVAVTMLRDAVSRRVALAMAIAGSLASCALLCTLVLYGVKYALKTGRQPIPALRFLLGDLFGTAMPIPSMFWVYLALPLGLGLLALRIGVDLVRQLGLWRSGQGLPAPQGPDADAVRGGEL